MSILKTRYGLFFWAILITGSKSWSQNPQLRIQLGHASSVTHAEYSPDGRYILTASNDKTAKIWDAQLGREIMTLEGHEKSVQVATYNADGSIIATVGDDRVIRTWNSSTGELQREIKGHKGEIFNAQWSPDGQSLLTAGYEDDINVWDMTSGELRFKLSGHERQNNFAYYFDGGSKILAKGPGNLFKTYTAEGDELLTFNGHSEHVTHAVWGGSKNIIVSTAEDHTINIWNGANGELLHSIYYGNKIHYLAFGDNDNLIAAATGNKKAIVWDTGSGEKVNEFPDFEKSVTRVLFSDNGQKLITASSDRKIRVWNLKNGEQEQLLDCDTRFIDLLFESPDSGLLMAGCGRGVSAWDRISGTLTFSLSGFSSPVTSTTFSTDGEFVITGTDNDMLTMWQPKSGELVHRQKAHRRKVADLDITSDDMILATAGRDKLIKLWDAASGDILDTLVGHKRWVTTLDFSPDNKQLVSGGWDKQVKVWDVATGSEIKNLEGHKYAVYSTQFSRNGDRIFSAGVDNLIKVWDPSDGSELLTIDGHTTDINAILDSPDGRFLAAASGRYFGPITVGSNGYPQLKIWDLQTGSEVHDLRGHTFPVVAIDYSPNGRQLISGSDDKSIKIWDTASGELIKTLNGHLSPVRSVQYSPEGNLILSGSYDHTFRLWDSDSGNELVAFLALDGGDEYVAFTPNEYYMSSKKALGALHFIVDGQVYLYEQFDLRLNRPDKVLQNIPGANPTLIAAYHRAYLKRLEKMGFTEEMLSGSYNTPELAIVNKADVPITTTNKMLSLSYQVTDRQSEIDRINVLVNNVPIYGNDGMSLRDQQASTVSAELDIELSNGFNKIQVSALNTSGIESLKETVEVTYTGSASTKDLYLVAIGVSDYDQQDMSLNFAAKDATDLVNLLKQQERYNEIVDIKVLNQDATKENISSLKDQLQQSKPDDDIVVFVAGHGLLDKNLDYYLGTSDIDFSDPATRGLPYEDLEGLLDGIQSRNKLLLIDACHSGEVDKSDTEEVSETASSGTIDETVSGAVAFRGFKKFKSKESDLGLQSSFELMKELFADLRRGSGTAVISSASGVEFAFESDEWQNGVFTYAFLQGITSMQADLDGDKQIRVSELLEYISTTVGDLTNGKQHPTSRREKPGI